MEQQREFTRVDLRGARFERVQLQGARFRSVDLSGAQLRGVSVEDVEIDGDIGGLRVNGVAIAPLVEAELLRRQPARAHWHATDPADLRAAWVSLRTSWQELVDRVRTMPEGTADRSVDDEWSFTETLRHLVCATDTWFTVPRGGTFHPWGLMFTDWPRFAPEGTDFGLDQSAHPSLDEVLPVRAERQAAVTAVLDDVTPEQLAERHPGPPWADEDHITLLQGIQVIIEEECEHLRFAERDLDAIDAGR